MKGNYFLLYSNKSTWTDKQGKEVTMFKYYLLDAEGEITVRSSMKDMGVAVPEETLGRLPRVTVTVKETSFKGVPKISLVDIKAL